jgi:hypothetical protein
VDSFSSQIGVGSCWEKLSWERIERRYLATFPEEMAVRNSASVELVAVMDCVFEQYVTTTPARRKL